MSTLGPVRIVCPACHRPIDVPINLALTGEVNHGGRSAVGKLTVDTAVIRDHIATWHSGPGGPGEPLPVAA